MGRSDNRISRRTVSFLTAPGRQTVSEAFHPFFRIYDFGEADTKTFPNHDNFAFGDHGSVHQNVQRITGQAIQFYDRPFIQAQQILIFISVFPTSTASWTSIFSRTGGFQQKPHQTLR